ncbi:MAG TPA: terminase gpA endonuclease subunit [Terriglobia bacterium]|nr:terminase gpA endonuclease subunit [Terriglobia bacterium]
MPSSRNSPSCTRCELELEPALISEADRLATFREIAAGLAELLKPKERLNIWQWAERRRFLARGVSAKSLEGKKLYCCSDAPHQRAPQEAATDPSVQLTVLVMASQVGGKTEIFNNVLGYHMDWAPRSCVVMYPTLDAAEKYSKKKFTPMVEASPALSSILRPARARDSGNTIFSKDFPAGSIYFVGANSPTSLRGTSGAVLLGDEVDSYLPSAGEEGDPIELLFKRAESFPNAVKLLASTPTVKGSSRIWDFFELSDQQYWFVPCPLCGKHQVLTWKQIQWPKDKPESAVLKCAHCAAALDDSQRLQMYYAGEWRATAPFKGIRGFHLNGIYAPWPAQKGYQDRLHQMAEEHIRASKKEKSEQVWVNTFLCELWEPKVLVTSCEDLLKRGEDYGPEKIPEGVIVVICSVDVQDRYLQAETIGLGLDDETWGMESRKFEGDTEQDDVWQDLAGHLGRTYTRADGAILPITATAVDMRHRGHMVRKLVQKGGIARVFPVYGSRNSQSPLLVTTRMNKLYRLRTFAINTRIAKDAIFARLNVEEQGPRYMHFPKGHGYARDYFDELTAEVLQTKKVRGVTIQSYEKVRERNEALDIRVYFLAVIDILKPALGVIDKHLRAGLKTQSELKDYQLKPPPEPKGGGDVRGPGGKPVPARGQAEPRRKIKVGGF